MRSSLKILPVLLLICLAADKAPTNGDGFIPLFPEDGAPKGWRMSDWSDVSKPPPQGAEWKVENGILHGSVQRGTWLVSEKTYGDFILDYEWKLGERGNSGCGIRIGQSGDPAFDALEIQMCDPRYNDPQDTPDKLTGSLYMALAPTQQVYKPTEWNHYRITAKGPRITVVLNGQTIQDVNLDEHKKPLKRHGGLPAPSLSERPRKGHIGFQELSRGGTHVMIRNAKIKPLD